MYHQPFRYCYFNLILLFPLLLVAQIEFLENGVDLTAGNLPCYVIKTATATYYLEKSGVGLSSLMDKDGKDWISFHPEVGSRAGGEFRGFPNAVHQQDGSFFHPKNSGTDPSNTFVEYAGKERVTIIGTSGNRAWECKWDFFITHCRFTMTKMPDGYKYWILYEGTPGGSYDDSDWWMTSGVTTKTPLTTTHEGDIPFPEWIVFGDHEIERSIFLLAHQDDNEIDRFYQMEKEMTVFGFGRNGIKKYLDSVPQSFSIGFLETTKHSKITEKLNKIQ